MHGRFEYSTNAEKCTINVMQCTDARQADGSAPRVGFMTSNGELFPVAQGHESFGFFFQTRLHNLNNRKWLSHIIDHCLKYSTKSSQTTAIPFLLLPRFISGMIVIMILPLIVILLVIIVLSHGYIKDKRSPPVSVCVSFCLC